MIGGLLCSSCKPLQHLAAFMKSFISLLGCKEGLVENEGRVGGTTPIALERIINYIIA